MASNPESSSSTTDGASNQDSPAEASLRKNLLELLELTKTIRKTPQTDITKKTLELITKRFLDQKSNEFFFDEPTETEIRKTGTIPPLNHAIWTCVADVTWAAQREVNRGFIKRLDEIDNQLDTIGTLLGGMENRLGASCKKLNKVAKRLSDIEDMLGRMEASLLEK